MAFDSNNAKKYMDLAQKALGNNELDAALQYIKKAHSLDPTYIINPKYNALKGEIEYYNNNLKIAIHDYKTAIELDPKNAEYYGDIAQIYLDLENYGEALKNIQKAIALNPSKKKVYDELIKEIAKGYDILGQRHINDDSLKVSINYFEKAKNLAPDNPIYHLDCGYAKSLDGQSEKAIKDFTTGISLNPEDISVFYEYRADAKCDFGDYTGAKEDYENALANNPDKDTYKEVKEHLKWVEQKLVEINKNFEKGQEEFNKEKYKRAIPFFEKARDLNPKNDEYHYWCGYAKYWNNQDEESIHDFDEAIKINPIPKYFYYRGHARHFIGQYEKAIDDFTTGINKNPDDVYNYYQLRADAKKAQKDYIGAKEDYEKALENNTPEKCDEIRNELNNIKEIIDKINIDKAKEFYDLGMNCREGGNYGASIKYFKKVIQLDPNNADAYYFYGHSEYCLGNIQNAIKFLTKGIKLNPKDVYYYFDLRGDIKKEQGDIEGARKDYLKAKENALDENDASEIEEKINKLEPLKEEIPVIDDVVDTEISDINSSSNTEELLNNQTQPENITDIHSLENRTSCFGIDFGTTNSALVSFTGVGDINEVITYGEKQKPIPSLVAIKKDGTDIITGNNVKQNIIKNPNFFDEYVYFSSIKSIIEKNEEYNINGKIYTPVDIAAELFRTLRSMVNAEGDVLNEAVVAIPIEFAANEKEKLREAAQKAGFEISMFISEPTAACCANYSKLKFCSNVAVFDWGGGTLDIAVIQIKDKKITELATSGIKCAGDDIDEKIARKVHKEFAQKTGKNISYDELSEKDRATLLARCEKAKCDISEEIDNTVKISINEYLGTFGFNTVLTYDVFKELTEEYINMAITRLDETIKKAGLNSTTLDCILCVGGSSNLKPLKEALNKKYQKTIGSETDTLGFEEKIFFPDKPMWNIAEGAAVIATRPGEFALSKDIGLLLSNEEFFPLLRAGQKIPTVNGSINFAMVESGDTAKLFLTDSPDEVGRDIERPITIPCKAFDDEIITLTYCIDPNFSLRLKLESNKSLINKVEVVNKVNVYYEVENESYE